MTENHAEYSSRNLESGQLLDIRADRIRKLEQYFFFESSNSSIILIFLH
jgi:hypothetical protein